MMLTTMLALTSCLGDNKDNIVYTHDAAITSFSLGTLNRYTYVESSTGADSLVKSTVTGSSYRFYIDQLNKEIYNPDSLPYGTDVAHVICTIGSKNAGTITIKSLTSDSLRYYSSSDSIDFSQPRMFRVFSNDGGDSNIYRIKVNVHQQEPDEFNWTLMSEKQDAYLTSASHVRLSAAGSDVYALMTTASGVTVLTNLKERIALLNTSGNGDSGTLDDADIELSGQAINNIAVKNGRLVVYEPEKNTLHFYGKDYEKREGIDARVSQLIGATDANLYALSTEGGLLASRDNGTTWTEEAVENANKNMLPNENIRLVSIPSKTNLETSRLVLAGLNTKINTVDNMMVWGKVEENGEYAESNQWFYYPKSAINKYPLPSLQNIQFEAYDDGILAFGTTSDEEISTIYFSRDLGITWPASTLVSFPDGFAPQNTAYAMTVDSENYLWLADGTTGKVWRGRLNRLGWTENQKSFTE